MAGPALREAETPRKSRSVAFCTRVAGGMRRSLLLSLTLLVACKSESPPPSGGPSVVTTLPSAAAAQASASAPAPPPRPRVIPTAQETTLTTSDKVSLAATWYGVGPTAPVIVMLHRLGGRRADWKPLVDRLLKDGPEASMLLVELRGHGQSGPAAEGRVGGGLKGSDIEAMDADVQAAVAEIDRRLGQPAATLVGVGSDLGATVLTRAARADTRWRALALLSPVGALRGVDIYRPFADVRKRRTLLAGIQTDKISLEPIQTMSTMVGANATMKLYEGRTTEAHNPGPAAAALWDGVAGWLRDTLAAPLPEVPAPPPPPVTSASAKASARPAAPPSPPKGAAPAGKK